MNNTLSINWEITKKCNLNCIYCRVCGGGEKVDELTEIEAKNIVDKLYQSGYQHLKFTGGEPLIKDYFWNLVKYAHQKGMLVSIFTNGVLITDKLLPNFKKYISIVAFSLDTLVDEHNKILKRNKALIIINNIKKIQKLDIPVVISATVSNITINDLEDLVLFVKDTGINEIKINDFVLNGRANDNEVILKLKRPLIEDQRYLINIIKSIYHEKILKNYQFRCECSNDDLFISYKGDLYPCVELSYLSDEYKIGNLVTDNIKDLLKTNVNFHQQIQDRDYCGYSYLSSTHFSACLNRGGCPKTLRNYMKLAKNKI